MAHLFIDGVSFDVIDLQTAADETLFESGLSYTADSEKYFGNNESLFLILRCAPPETPKIKGARLEVAEDKLYIVVEGACPGYTQTDFAADIQETKGDRIKFTMTTEAEITDGAFKLTAEVIRIDKNTAYIFHLLVAGKIYDIVNLTVTEQTAQIGENNYKLTCEKLFGDNDNLFLVLRNE